MSSEPQDPSQAESAVWDKQTRRKFEKQVAHPRSLTSSVANLRYHSKSTSEFYDPCQAAAQQSYKCLFRNGGDKSMCGEYFQYV
jgi:cytochrome c oxidase assembly protein subunit 23|uniref:Cytochrome c oxidase-assembly factor COX23, mitochondrial n=1 Tax=Bionectria ochroleuca TaxID=29856 RepID=A0A0B7K5X7_BIOOC